MKRSRATSLIASAVLLLVLVFLYGWGYFALSSRTQVSVWTQTQQPPPREVRLFRSKWQALVFGPAVKVEALLTGEEIGVAWR